MAKKKFVPLSDDLERLALGAIMRGLVPPSDLNEEELSKLGKLTLRAITNLREDPDAPDILDPVSVRTVASELLGGDRRELGLFIKACNSTCAGMEVRDILRSVREKSLLVDVLNETGNQLATGRLDIGRIGELVSSQETGSVTLSSASEMLRDGIPPEPKGASLPSLRHLTESSGGLIGMWAVAAEAGVGKSTLALQIAVDYCRPLKNGYRRPCLYYDFENGPDIMLHRLGKRYKMNVEVTQEASETIYFRESIRTLNADVKQFSGHKCLIIVDSLQKLPTSVEHRRTSLDSWVHRLEALKKKGHRILIISEKNREEYGKASQRGFKETGEIEYSADFGFHLVSDKYDPSTFGIFIVKNRHRPITGRICSLVRVNNFGFEERV